MLNRERPRIRLIATDIDGTLLDSASQLPPANRAALVAALAQGVQLALVTARKRSSTLAVAELLGLPCACIAHNGARTWDWTGQELGHLRLPLPLAREIVLFADRAAIPLIATVDEVNYRNRHYRWRVPGDPMGERTLEHTADLPGAPTRIIVTGSAGADAIGAAFGGAADTLTLHRYYSREGAIDSAVLTHPAADKAHAVAALAERVGIAAGEVLALGDAEADAGMLAWAGVGVAMGNAMPQARAAARWIAPSHDEAGFAAAVRRWVLDVPEAAEQGGR